MFTLDDSNPLCLINELWLAAQFLGARLKRSLRFAIFR
jgi:hypothetical protein